jgi:hypothetical protein
MKWQACSSAVVAAAISLVGFWGSDAFAQTVPRTGPSPRSSETPSPLPPASQPSGAPGIPPEQSPALTPQAAPLQSAVPAPSAEEIRFRRVMVRLDSDKPDTVIERRVSVKEETGAFIVLPYRTVGAIWEPVCVTPCQVSLDRYSTYRVSGQNGVTQSHPFTLPQGVDALALHVDAGSAASHRTGLFLSGLGLVAAVVGASLVIDAQSLTIPAHQRETRDAGLGTGGAGIVGLAVGIPLAIGTLTHLRSDSGQKVSNVTPEGGHKLPFLPDIKIGKAVTLTQRGFVF